MKRRLLITYQMVTGLTDAYTGVLLLFEPALTLRLMRLSAPEDALPFLSFVGVFVLSVGIMCLYGAVLAARADSPSKLEVVWLFTAIMRGLVGIFVISKILSGTLETGWAIVAISDGACALLQTAGLGKGWLHDAA